MLKSTQTPTPRPIKAETESPPKTIAESGLEEEEEEVDEEEEEDGADGEGGGVVGLEVKTAFEAVTSVENPVSV